MKARGEARTTPWAGVAVLVVAAAILAFISVHAMQAVLVPQKEAAADAQARVYSWQADTSRVHEKNQLLAAARSGARNPFTRAVAAASPSGSRTVAPPPVAVERVPGWSARLIDRIDPRIKLTVDGIESDWVHVNDTYRGWKVLRITENAVTISKGERIEVVPWIEG